MPTEHEFKYVLSLFTDVDSMPWEKCFLIRQGYLAFSKGMTTRIRSIQAVDETGSLVGKPKWYLTFKQKVRNRVIEIEKKLDDRDGADLWAVCVGKLKKYRHVVDNEGIKWEVDLFFKGNHQYFVLAEVELEEGSPRPKILPDFLKQWVVYEVPLTDDRFSNKRLGDVEFATDLYNKMADGDTHDGYTNNTNNNENTEGL